jgi:hypothetical protein
MAGLLAVTGVTAAVSGAATLGLAMKKLAHKTAPSRLCFKALNMVRFPWGLVISVKK